MRKRGIVTMGVPNNHWLHPYIGHEVFYDETSVIIDIDEYHDCFGYEEAGYIKPEKLSQVFAKRHIIYTYKGEVYEAEKYWSIEHAEKVLNRLGATYWEISI